MQPLRIREIAHRAGLAPFKIRLYEHLGLIASLGGEGEDRRYNPSVLDRLERIAEHRAAGLTLDEIALIAKQELEGQ